MTVPRIINVNRADLATSLTASTTATDTLAANMQNDRKVSVHRSTGTSVSYTATWATAVTIGAVTLPATNLTVNATIRVRLYDATSAGTLLADSGVVAACPGLDLGLWSWTGAIDANAFPYGGASKSAVFFDPQISGVKRVEVDLVDTGNPAGFIDCARLIAGPWTVPEFGASDATITPVDLTENKRADSGDLLSDRATTHQVMRVALPVMSETDRAAHFAMLRGNGAWRGVFVWLDAAQDKMIYGKLKPAPFDYAFYAHWATNLEIESW